MDGKAGGNRRLAGAAPLIPFSVFGFQFPVKKIGNINELMRWFVSFETKIGIIQSCSQKTMIIHVILNGAPRSEESRRL